MARLLLLVVWSVMTTAPEVASGGPVSSAADRFMTGIKHSEARVRRLLHRLGRSPEPLARRCLQDKLRRLRRCVDKAHPTRRGAGARPSVALTRAYVEAIILADEARQCQELVGLRLSPRPARRSEPTRTRVTVSIDREIAADPLADGW